MRGFRKGLAIAALTSGLGACTNISDPNLLSLNDVSCFAGASCGCLRSVVEIIAPNLGSNMASYRDLTPYLLTPPLPNVRFGLGGGLGNGFMWAGFFVNNRYGTYVLRNGQRINNAFAIVSRFRFGIPTDDPTWNWMENATLHLGVLTSSGGVRLRLKPPGGVWQTAIDQPNHYRSRFHCASQPVTLHVGEWTEVELTTNIADGDSALFSPTTYVRRPPFLPELTPTYEAGAYGGTALMVGPTWSSASNLPPAVPILSPNPGASCGNDFYHLDDPQIATPAPPGTKFHADLALNHYFAIPSEIVQVTTSDSQANPNLPYCAAPYGW